MTAKAIEPSSGLQMLEAGMKGRAAAYFVAALPFDIEALTVASPINFISCRTLNKKSWDGATGGFH